MLFFPRVSSVKDKHFRIEQMQEVPFECCCPSLKEVVSSRTFKCGQYHGKRPLLCISGRASTKQPSSVHETSNKGQEPSTVKIKPERLAAMRKIERMVIWTSRLISNIDWFD